MVFFTFNTQSQILRRLKALQPNKRVFQDVQIEYYHTLNNISRPWLRGRLGFLRLLITFWTHHVRRIGTRILESAANGNRDWLGILQDEKISICTTKTCSNPRGPLASHTFLGIVLSCMAGPSFHFLLLWKENNPLKSNISSHKRDTLYNKEAFQVITRVLI